MVIARQLLINLQITAQQTKIRGKFVISTLLFGCFIVFLKCGSRVILWTAADLIITF